MPYPNKTALIMSIGVGDKGGDVREIYRAALDERYDYYVFVVTSESKSKIDDVINERNLAPEMYEYIHIDDPNNINKTFDAILRRAFELNNMNFSLDLNFTAGTKPMSAAVVLVAIALQARNLIYSSGPRQNGVALYTEESRKFKARIINDFFRAKQVVAFVHNFMFDSALQLIRDIRKIPLADDLEIEAARQIIEFYEEKERFNYRGAKEKLTSFEKLGNFNRSFLKAIFPNKQKRSLYQILTPDNPKAKTDYLLIIDLYMNGCNKIRMGHYADALIRFYSVIEHILKIRLLNRGIDNSNLDWSRIADNVKNDFLRRTNLSELPEKTPLKMTAILLSCLADDFAQDLLANAEFERLMAIRNQLILEHAWEYVSEKDIMKWRKFTYNYLKKAVPALDDRIAELMYPFAKLEYYIPSEER